MIVQNLKVFSQNVWKNSLIINTILETQSQFDIIFIQEPPQSEIHKIPSSFDCKGETLIGITHYFNWLLFVRISLERLDSSRVIAYINICLSSFHFLLHKDIINHRDIILISFLNNHVCYYIMNIYSDSSHSALKYLKDIEVNIDNILIMTGNFNIRDSLQDPSFPHYSSISDDLIIIANLFNLTLLMPTNLCSTRYSDTAGKANLVIDLMFLCYRSRELNQHSIHPNSYLSSDHAPLSINIPIDEEIICTSKSSILQKSEQETAFVEEVISNFKNLDISNIADTEKLEHIVNQLEVIIDQA